MKVLIIKTSSMGDIIHTLPSLTDAKKIIPNIHFHWIVEENFSQIPTWHRAVDQIFPISIRRWRNSLFSKSVRTEYNMFKKQIRLQYYDAIIDSQGLIKSSVFITRLARGIKHGMDWKSVREPLASFFYGYRHNILKNQHAIERIRELFAKSLGYSKPRIPIDYGISHYFLHNKKSSCAPYIIFLHSTTRKNKHWPKTHWRKLIKLLQPNGTNIKLVSYTKREQQRAKYLASGFSNIEVLPKLSLLQVAKKLFDAKAIISIDTGLSHLAAALNKPNIVLFGPTKSNLVGGLGKNQHHIISTTSKMQDITPNEVLELIQEKEILV